MCMIKEYDPSPILPLIKSGTRLPLICVYTEFRAKNIHDTSSTQTLAFFAAC